MTILRSVETSLAPAVKEKKVRLMEETGQQLRSMLCWADPWERVSCARDQCSTCADQEKGVPGSCRTKSVVYTNTCTLCRGEGKVAQYVGESARTLWERGQEHARDAKGGAEKSHIGEHLRQEHPGVQYRCSPSRW